MHEKIAPDFQISGNMRLSIGVNAQGCREQRQFRAGAEDRPSRARAGDLAAQRVVKALHTFGLGEVSRGRTVYSREHIEVTGHPAVVRRHEFFKESAWIGWRNADHCCPSLRRAWHHRGTVANLKHAAEKVEYMGVDFQLCGAG